MPRTKKKLKNTGLDSNASDNDISPQPETKSVVWYNCTSLINWDVFNEKMYIVVLFGFEIIKLIPIFFRFRTQRILQIDELIVLIVINYFRRKCHKNKTRKSFVSFSFVSSSPFLYVESHLEFVGFHFVLGWVDSIM